MDGLGGERIIFKLSWRWNSAPLGQPHHSIALVCVSLILACGAWFFYSEIQSLLKDGHSVEGKVVQVIQNKSGSYAPVVEFTDIIGNSRQFRSSIFTSSASYPIGGKVMVIYLPNRTDEAKIRDTLHLWFPSLLLGGMSILFLIAAILLWVYRDFIFTLARAKF